MLPTTTMIEVGLRNEILRHNNAIWYKNIGMAKDY